MDYILGIDQGATKTLVALADLQGNILSFGKAPGGYHAITGIKHAVTQMKTAADAAEQAVNADKKHLVAVGAGLTGADFPYEYSLLHEALLGAFGVPNKVVNDCMVALRAESSVPGSMVICAGTGLNIGLLDPTGQEFAFGYYIDDRWQGGSSIGRRCLQMVFESDIDMQPPTILTNKVLEHFDKSNVFALMEWWYNGDGAKELKYLAPIVDDCANRGDAVAQKVLRYFADGCSRYALAGMRSHHMMDKPMTVYLSGSIFKSKVSLLLDSIRSALQEENPQAQIVDAQFEPVVGGVIIALEKAYGGAVPPQVIQRVHDSARIVSLTRSSWTWDGSN